MLIPMGKEKHYTVATTSGAIVSVLGNLLLIPHFGIFGSGVACIIAEATVFAVSYWNLRDIFSLFQVLKDNLGIIIGSVVMYFSVRVIATLDIPLVLKLILELCGGMAVYFIIAIVTKNETFFLIYDKITAVFKKIFKQRERHIK